MWKRQFDDTSYDSAEDSALNTQYRGCAVHLAVRIRNSLGPSPELGHKMLAQLCKRLINYRQHAERLTGAFAAALSLIACGNSTGPIIDSGRLVSIGIYGDSSVQIGDTVRLKALGNVSGLIGIFTYDRLLDAVWTVSDPRVVSIVTVKPVAGDTTASSAVILTGLRQGTVQVTATARGVQGSATVRVLLTP